MYIIIRPTWVWVIPKLAANGARSGNPKYWVLWKWRSNCWSCKDEYMDRGFRIFFPFPLTRVTSSPFSTTGSAISWPPMKSIYNECGCMPHTHECHTATKVLTDLSSYYISGAGLTWWWHSGQRQMAEDLDVSFWNPGPYSGEVVSGKKVFVRVYYFGWFLKPTFWVCLIPELANWSFLVFF